MVPKTLHHLLSTPSPAFPEETSHPLKPVKYFTGRKSWETWFSSVTAIFEILHHVPSQNSLKTTGVWLVVPLTSSCIHALACRVALLEVCVIQEFPFLSAYIQILVYFPKILAKIGARLCLFPGIQTLSCVAQHIHGKQTSYRVVISLYLFLQWLKLYYVNNTQQKHSYIFKDFQRLRKCQWLTAITLSLNI